MVGGFGDRLEVPQRARPELVEVAAQGGDAFGVDAIDVAGARALLLHEMRGLSARRCCDTAGRDTGKPSASSPTAMGRRTRRSKMARRVGSARAASWISALGIA